MDVLFLGSSLTSMALENPRVAWVTNLNQPIDDQYEGVFLFLIEQFERVNRVVTLKGHLTPGRLLAHLTVDSSQYEFDQPKMFQL